MRTAICQEWTRQELSRVGIRGFLIIPLLFLACTKQDPTQETVSDWNSLPSSTSHTLTAVHFVGPTTGWVVGEKGTILHTEDGGDTWVSQAAGLR